MDYSALILLPIGLGLFGFIEPCTIGGHLLFLDTQKSRGVAAKINEVLVFVAARALVTGLFGAVISMLGAWLISVQTGMWLLFGAIYLLVGIAFLIGQAGLVKRRIDFAPVLWKQAQNPLVLGLAFGLNIPACAAPILFGLLGLAATSGTVLNGFMMMFIFGFFLSAPLMIFAIVPKWAAGLDRIGQKLKSTKWVIGAIFVLLGLWSIWFGLYVNPPNWSGQT